MALVQVQRRTQPVAYWTLVAAYTLFVLWVLKYGIGRPLGPGSPSTRRRQTGAM